ncbi:ComEC/Rec2 family competence protein [Pseudoduganella lutea]|uniref:MBL fold metallo-hydrolase n=1 Tax=Pseudoduganella lutea TaxID=321985 RepID=A0A4P6KVH5_9BURK|nr:MBL fold metallo-hydrolase [Pseudoduganella lutea]QBE62856.1 MBL fold metallo-hydrolase [Pseudoduganella lutea]
MVAKSVINIDLADVFASIDREKYLHTLAWGDEVDVLEATDSYLRIATVRYENRADGSILPIATEAYICPRIVGIKPADIIVPAGANRVLKVDFVDVQQGDGAVIESPDGKIILVDGGDNQLFARYLAARFRGTSADNPQEIDCIVVTHGDADHFSGLTEIHESENNQEARKRLFIAPKRIFHNGIVKRPGKDASGKRVADANLLGPIEKVGAETVLVGLVDNLLDVPDHEMNRPFRQWKNALATWNERSAVEMRRIAAGDHDAFDFFTSTDLKISVLGPLPMQRAGITGLKFLGKPPRDPASRSAVLDANDKPFTGLSASHTINGHSIVFRLQYGAMNFLFTGDLNEEASRELARQHEAGEITLRSEILKVPHHGSADFSNAFLRMVAPIVSIVSSGDESASKEYIHPRATLVGALGRHSRSDEPLIFVTELIAFFKREGWAQLADKGQAAERGEFYAFSRTAYGMVRTRTDGKRLLVFTNSGKANMKEAYCFSLDNEGVPVPAAVIRA